MNTRGMNSARKEHRRKRPVGSTVSTLITCQMFWLQASSMERSRFSAVAPAASRSPSPHVDTLQRPAGSSRNDDSFCDDFLRMSCVFHPFFHSTAMITWEA